MRVFIDRASYVYIGATPSNRNVLMTETPTFAAGDVVRLKSGGPKMTVLDMDGDDAVACKWFDRNGKVHSDSFPFAMIEPFISQW